MHERNWDAKNIDRSPTREYMLTYLTTGCCSEAGYPYLMSENISARSQISRKGKKRQKGGKKKPEFQKRDKDKNAVEKKNACGAAAGSSLQSRQKGCRKSQG